MEYQLHVGRWRHELTAAAAKLFATQADIIEKPGYPVRGTE